MEHSPVLIQYHYSLTSSLNLNRPCSGVALTSVRSSTVDLSGFSSLFPLQSPRTLGDSRDRKLVADLRWPPWYRHTGPFQPVGFSCRCIPPQRVARPFVPLSLRRHEPLTWVCFTHAHSWTGVCLYRHDAGSSQHTPAHRADTTRTVAALRQSGATIRRKHIIFFTNPPLPTYWSPAVPRRFHDGVWQSDCQQRRGSSSRQQAAMLP